MRSVHKAYTRIGDQIDIDTVCFVLAVAQTTSDASQLCALNQSRAQSKNLPVNLIILPTCATGGACIDFVLQ